MSMIKIPNHVAIIPDGNRRWAKEHNMPVIEGHRRGAENFIRISEKAFKMGIKILTLWAFSTENWKRATDEVRGLMKLFDYMIDKQFQKLFDEKIRIIHIGRKDRLGKNLANKIIRSEEKTKSFDQHYLVFGLDYGGRDEIIRAIGKMANTQANIQENDFAMYLDTKDLPYPNPDLIIRTSGEQRTSGFMPWQAAYSEYVFVDKYFPDFSPQEFEKTVHDYSLRNRRFGI